MRIFLTAISLLLIASISHAETYKIGGGCGELPAHIPDANVAATTASSVNMNTSHALPLDNIAIPLEIPLSDYTNTAGINADLSETRIRPGDISVNTKTGTASFNGQDITAQPLIDPDCAEKSDSLYSTK